MPVAMSYVAASCKTSLRQAGASSACSPFRNSFSVLAWKSMQGCFNIEYTALQDSRPVTLTSRIAICPHSSEAMCRRRLLAP